MSRYSSIGPDGFRFDVATDVAGDDVRLSMPVPHDPSGQELLSLDEARQLATLLLRAAVVCEAIRQRHAG